MLHTSTDDRQLVSPKFHSKISHFASHLFLTLLDRLNDLINDRRISKSRSITKLVLLARENLPQNTTHNLSRTSLGQVRNDKDGFGSREGADGFSDLEDEVFPELVVDFVAVFDRDEGVDCLAREFVVDTHDSGFANSGVLDERGFDFGGTETVTGDVDDVVDTAADPVVALGVSCGSVTREVVSLVDVEVGVHISLVCAVDGTGH